MTDSSPGTYGDNHTVSQVVVGSNGRITGISNVAIVETSNVHQVLLRGSTTTSNIITTGDISCTNLYVTNNAYITNHIYDVQVQQLTVGNALVSIGYDNVTNLDSGLLINNPSASNVATIFRSTNSTYYMGYVSNPLGASTNLTFTGQNLPVYLYGNITASNGFIGSGAQLTNVTDSAPGTYGGTTTIPTITVSSSGRITSISNVTSSVPTLNQVANSGNTTSNILQFTNGFITGNGFVGINTSANGAQMTIVNSNSSQTVLSIKSATGQTANLQQWSNNGTVAAYINPSGSLHINGNFSRKVPITYSNNTTVAITDSWIICDNGVSANPFVIVLPSASVFPGREIYIRKGASAAAGALYNIVSSVANIIALEDRTAVGTNIISNGYASSQKVSYGDLIYRWATLVSDGTNWVIMAGA